MANTNHIPGSYIARSTSAPSCPCKRTAMRNSSNGGQSLACPEAKPSASGSTAAMTDMDRKPPSLYALPEKTPPSSAQCPDSRSSIVCVACSPRRSQMQLPPLPAEAANRRTSPASNPACDPATTGSSFALPGHGKYHPA